jgi:DNA-binding NtrC family response regulator
MIHFHSAGAEAPFVHVACEALRDAPFEAERTFAPAPASRSQLDQWDSLADKPGGGTLFLQDVGKLPLWAQIKLLCTLEDGWPSALAADESWTGKVRVIASTNGGLENDVAEGRFHRGLYDRLNLAPIKVPPLRERPQDIEALARHYLEQFSRSSRGKNGRACCDIPQDQWELLLRYRWPGNARELESVMARAILAGSGIGADSSVRDYLRTPSAPPDNGQTMAVPLAGDLKAIERHIIREMVRRCGGNKAAAARALGMHRRTLYRILEDGRMCAQARI